MCLEKVLTLSCRLAWCFVARTMIGLLGAILVLFIPSSYANEVRTPKYYAPMYRADYVFQTHQYGMKTGIFELFWLTGQCVGWGGIYGASQCSPGDVFLSSKLSRRES